MTATATAIALAASAATDSADLARLPAAVDAAHAELTAVVAPESAERVVQACVVGRGDRHRCDAFL